MSTEIKRLGDTNQQISVLISGYIKDNETSLKLDIPAEIAQIICQYFKLNEFTFDRPSPCFIIGDDKLSITTTTAIFKDTKEFEAYGTIQFGQFLKSTDKLIYTVTFLMKEIMSGSIGIGFLRPSFNQWIHQHFNKCEKYSTYIYCNSYYRASPVFDELNKQYENANSLTNWNSGSFCDSGGKVMVEMNMITMKAKMTFVQNEEKKCRDNKKTHVYEINLPDDVAIMIDVGSQGQFVQVLEQQFVYL